MPEQNQSFAGEMTFSPNEDRDLNVKLSSRQGHRYFIQGV